MMDEDIDIEEHNIWDNPQLKNILPNIDNIKEEPLDYDDNYEEYTNDYCDDAEEMDVDPYLDDDGVASEDSLEMQSDPKLRPGMLKYLRVVLEDWGPHLERSACFCNECETLFATRNALDAHNMAAHSFLVAMDSPKEESPKQPSPSLSNKYCSHCNKYFDDSNQLIQHLYDLITAKKNIKARAASITIGTKTPEQISEPVPQKFWYRCVYCSVYSNYRNNLRRHYNKFHNKYIPPTETFSYDPKCKFCKEVFAHPKTYNIHIKVGHPEFHFTLPGCEKINDPNLRFKCPHCTMSFETKIRTKIHISRVHKHLKHLNLKIRAIQAPVANKVTEGLPKANTVKPKELQNATGLPKANTLKPRELQNATGLPKANTLKPRELQNATGLQNAIGLPKANTVKPKELKNATGLPKANTLKPRQLQNVTLKSGFKIKLANSKSSRKFKYYQCQNCMCCLERVRRVPHVCTPDKFRKTCPKCQYIFSTKGLYRHNKKHLRMKNLTRANITIVPFNCPSKSAKSGAHNQVPSKANGHIYKCSCGIHFPTRDSIMKHSTNCSLDQNISCKECVKCGLIFPTNLLVNHTVNHHSDENKKFVVHNVPTLFKCVKCKCLFLKRQSLSNHQRVCDGAIVGEKCIYCMLLFHKSVGAEHMESHLPVPSKQTTKKKPDKVLLYKCRKCKIHFVDKTAGLYHASNHKNLNTPNVGCKICGLRFLKRDINIHFDLHHKKRKCTLEDFQFESLFVRDLKTEDTDKETRQIKPVAVDNSATKQKKLNVYKHMQIDSKHRVNDVPSHMPKCEVKGNVKKTKNKTRPTKVKQRLHERLRNAATERHSDRILNSLEVVRIDSGSLYKCTKCNVHYCSKATFEKHVYQNHNTGYALVDCPDCDRKFTKLSCGIHKKLNICKRDHLKPEKNVASTLKEESLEIVRINSGSLFKCTSCNVHYCNKATFEKHIYHNHNIACALVDCPDCDRKFTKISCCIHKKLNICKRDHLKPDKNVASTPVKEHCAPEPQAIAVKSPKVTEQDTVPSPIHSSYDFKLYKCEQCNVYFMGQQSCYKHTVNHIPMRPVEYISCKLCNLQFRVSALTYHVKKHHSGKEVEKVLVEKYSCNGLSDIKVDIYVHTIDKVQTNLVSTTTDDNDEVPDTVININEISTTPGTTEPAVDTATSKDVVPFVMDTETTANVPVESSSGEPENFDDSTEIKCDEIKYNSSFCDEIFNNNTSKELHERLDLKDGFKECKICGSSFSASILDESHLGVNNDTFNCCICKETFSVEMLLEHSKKHKNIVSDS